MAKHNITVTDSGIAFEIVPNTKKIIVPQMHKVIGAVGDVNSEKVTFRCPKLIDGHDISGCSRKYVTWKNTEGTIGHCNLGLLSTDENYAYFEWLIPEGLTVSSGLVSFSIHFEDVDRNGRYTYRWGTAPCNECEILESVNGKLGTYRTVYVDGDTLVISDFVPVDGNILSLENVPKEPEGTIEITNNGVHNVKDYAEAKVQVSSEAPSFEEPSISVANGLVTAEANGLSSVYPLKAPSITVEDGLVTAEANGLQSAYELEAPVISSGNDGLLIAEANGLQSAHQLEAPGFSLDGETLTAEANGMESEYTLESPTIRVDSTGLITATANGLSATHYLSSNNDTDFLPKNIAKGKTIFGLEGQFGDEFYRGKIKFVNVSNERKYAVSLYYVQKDPNGTQTAWCKNGSWIRDGETIEVEVLKDSIIVVRPINITAAFDPMESSGIETISDSHELSAGRVTGNDFFFSIINW